MSQKPDLHEMAAQYLATHPNDKSNSLVAKMNRRFGKKATMIAIQQAIDVQLMVDPGSYPELLSKWIYAIDAPPQERPSWAKRPVNPDPLNKPWRQNAVRPRRLYYDFYDQFFSEL